MNYFISREDKQYGPYTLADLQRYVASGEVLVSDLATSEGMSTPTTVGQIIGNVAAPPVYPVSSTLPVAAIYPAPPNLHWGLVLLFTLITCGVFGIIWEIIQGVWMKKVDPLSKALALYVGAAACLGGIFFASFFSAMVHGSGSYAGLLQIAYSVALLIGRFNFRSSMERHYNLAEPMGLSLSGVMTFFFGGIYFQYHFNDIMRRKMLDQMYGAR